MYISVFQRSLCCCIVLRKKNIPQTLAYFSANEVILSKIIELKGEQEFVKQPEKCCFSLWCSLYITLSELVIFKRWGAEFLTEYNI